MHVKNDILYFVNGTTLYSLDRTIDGSGNDVFGFTLLGTIPGTGPVSMADNGTQLMVLIPGVDGYIYDENAGIPFQLIASGFKANGNPQIVVFIDGYFVATTDTKKFISSAPNDGNTWDPIDAGTAEADPDIIRGVTVFQNQLMIFGSETMEGFSNPPTGTAFPFIRIGGMVIQKGLFAPFSVVPSNNTFMFIGGGTNESPAIWMFNGNGVDKISTTAVDFLLSKLTDAELEGVIGVSYADKGAYFSGWSLPGVDIYYDSISGRWHERNTFSDGQLSGWRVGFMATAYGRVIVGDSIDGRIGELDPDVYTEYGDTIFRRVITQPLVNLGDSISIPYLELVMESGVGDLVTKEPLVRFRYSDDAKTWSNQTSRKIGRIGEFFKRQIWRRQGRAPRFRLFEFTITDPVKPIVIGLYLRPKVGRDG